MKAAYVDTSCLLALAFEERGIDAVVLSLGRYDELFSSDLLQAELMAAVRREGVTRPPVELLRHLVWVFPERTLRREFDVVLEHGYIKGADLWHLSCASFLRDQIGPMGFLTLDKRQAQLARELGFNG